MKIGRAGWKNIDWSGAYLPSGLTSPNQFKFYCPWCESRDPEFLGLRGAMIDPFNNEMMGSVVGNGNVAIRQHFLEHMEKEKWLE